MQQLIETLSEIPPLAGIDHSRLDIERLGGLTNANYKIIGPQISVVVRLAGAGTDAYVNRATEVRNASAAAAAGVAPEVLYSDDRRGIIVTRFVEGAQPLDTKRAATAPYPARIGRRLQELHTRSGRFANTFNPFYQLDRYVAILDAHRLTPPDGFLQARTKLDGLRGVLDARAAAFAPCHCDVLPENILDDGTRLFIIDYEFSGNCDPLWDLGDFSGEAALGDSEDWDLLQGYYAGPVSAEAEALFIAYKALSLLLAAGWAQVQIANANTIANFEDYTQIRLTRCWAVIERGSFQGLLDVLTHSSNGRSDCPQRASIRAR